MRQTNTLLIFIIAAILLWLAGTNRLRNLPAAWRVLEGGRV